jgi:polyphosphate kinase 2 (PPK2 family)
MVRALPQRGKVGIFAISHHEDVLVAKVRKTARARAGRQAGSGTSATAATV